MNDELRNQAALYALGALPADEKASFEAALANSPELQEEVALHRRSTTALDRLADVSPPAELRQSVMDEIANTPQVHVGGADIVDLTAARTSRRTVVLAAAAAVLVIVLGIGTFLTQNADQPAVYASVAEQPDAREVELVGEGASSVRVAWSATDGKYALSAEDLPDPGEGRAYALWFIGDSGEPQPSGLFVATSGRLEIDGSLPGDPSVWAITIEPETGSPAPTGEILYAAEA